MTIITLPEFNNMKLKYFRIVGQGVCVCAAHIVSIAYTLAYTILKDKY